MLEVVLHLHRLEVCIVTMDGLVNWLGGPKRSRGPLGRMLWGCNNIKYGHSHIGEAVQIRTAAQICYENIQCYLQPRLSLMAAYNNDLYVVLQCLV